MQAKTRNFGTAQLMLLGLLGISAQAADMNPLGTMKKISDGDEYLRYQLPASAGGTLPLVDASTLRVVGVSTFDKNRLNPNTRMVLEKIRFAVAEVTTSGMTAGAANQRYSTKQSDCPLPLIGAHFIIRQSGKTLLEIPVQRMLNLGIVDGLVGDDAFVLDTPFVLDDTDLEILIRFPDSSAAVAWTAGKTQFVELHFIGPKANLA